MTEIRDTDQGIIERVYYAVPDYYGTGTEFSGTPEGHREAVAFAKSKIEPLYKSYARTPESIYGYSRAWVDKRYTIRWLPAAGEIASGLDTVVERTEIFLTETEKKERT